MDSADAEGAQKDFAHILNRIDNEKVAQYDFMSKARKWPVTRN